MIDLIVLTLGLVALGALHVYDKKESSKGDYLWVGFGKDPFKR